MKEMKKILNEIAVLFVIVFFSASWACNMDTKQDEESNKEVDSLQQSKEDLLGGITRAVCYSGFRTGQHPDRGEGRT